MKAAGITICIISAVFLVIAVKLVLTEYNLANTDDIGKCVGSFLPGVLLLALGIYLFQRGSRPPAPPSDIL
ncbi:MAG: hypothetical protein K8T25_08460 [Planctomycetia bacterium]|nr:hypothetical protein [Planctomycetia bacterium]